MRQYITDLQDTHDPAEILALAMGIVSIIMVLHRFLQADQRVRSLRSGSIEGTF